MGVFVNLFGDLIFMCVLVILLSVMYVIVEWICCSNECKCLIDNMGIDKLEFDI